jgi:hypothetical protein
VFRLIEVAGSDCYNNKNLSARLAQSTSSECPNRKAFVGRPTQRDSAELSPRGTQSAGVVVPTPGREKKTLVSLSRQCSAGRDARSEPDGTTAGHVGLVNSADSAGSRRRELSCLVAGSLRRCPDWRGVTVQPDVKERFLLLLVRDPSFL